jgi:hypothetical protein
LRYGHSVIGCKSAKNISQLIWRVKGKNGISSVTPAQKSKQTWRFRRSHELSDVPSQIYCSAPSTTLNFSFQNRELLGSVMANYPCNPFSFVSDGLAIDHGPPNRRVRCDLAISPVPPLHHDNYAIAETNLDIPIQQRFHARRELRRMLHHDGFQVCNMEDYAIGLGLYSFFNQFVRDIVVGRTYNIRLIIGLKRPSLCLENC